MHGNGNADDAASACEEEPAAGSESGECTEQAARSIVTLSGCPTICLETETADSARVLAALLASGPRSDCLFPAVVPDA